MHFWPVYNVHPVFNSSENPYCFHPKKEQKIWPKRQKGKVRFIILAFKKMKDNKYLFARKYGNEKVLRET